MIMTTMIVVPRSGERELGYWYGRGLDFGSVCARDGDERTEMEMEIALVEVVVVMAEESALDSIGFEKVLHGENEKRVVLCYDVSYDQDRKSIEIRPFCVENMMIVHAGSVFWFSVEACEVKE